jgi:hypothetical protein
MYGKGKAANRLHWQLRSNAYAGLLVTKGGDRFKVFSAGTTPTHVRPEAITVRAVGCVASNPGLDSRAYYDVLNGNDQAR